ncbi:MAG: hypothetical protein ACRC7O_16955, partial [Fimbriiglobus sp.]
MCPRNQGLTPLATFGRPSGAKTRVDSHTPDAPQETPMFPATRRAVLSCLFLLTAVIPGRAADPVDAALAKLADPVIAFAREKHYPTLGVLKATVALPGSPADAGGELGTALARRFEVALVLADPDEELMVLRRPGETVAANKDKVADHRTAAGRKKFFLHKFAPAWGDADAAADADAFVVLSAVASPKLDTLELKAELFDKSGELVAVPGATGTAPLSRRALAELGCAYRADGGKTVIAGARGMDPSVLKNNLPAQNDEAAPPAQPVMASRPAELFRDGPVKFQIFYGDAEVPVETLGSFSRVRTPGKDDKVHFVLTNTTADPVAAVLKVNGENTIERSTAADERCRKWILEPGKPVNVRGYLRANNKEWETFRVLGDDEADAEAVKYGPHAGTFRLAVFTGKMVAAAGSPDSAPPADDATSTTLAIARGSVDAGGDRPGSLKALKQRLRKAAPAEAARGGLVVPGGEVESKAVE